MIKKRIVHIIDTLNYGGSEILLRNTIPLLPEFSHTIIYLNRPDPLKIDFSEEVELICLEYQSWFRMPSSIQRLKRLIRQRKPLLVHSHLFMSNILARLATDKNIPLFTSLHSTYSIDAFGSKKALFLERLTVRNWHTLVAVSKMVMKDYLQFIPFKGPKRVLYNFIPDSHFTGNEYKVTREGDLRCVAIGNLKEAKNYTFLLQVFRELKNSSITLDIYGQGGLEKTLQHIITSEQLPVRLMGKTDDVSETLRDYDLFIQASSHEGFGLSVIEAIAAGLPVLLSDIPVFHEITDENAHFFSLDHADKAAEQLKVLARDTTLLHQHQQAAYVFAERHFSQSQYRKQLEMMYNLASLQLTV